MSLPMKKKCCCLDSDCLLYADNFDRSELGSNWSGSGSIVGGVLYANEDSITICHPPDFPLGALHGEVLMKDCDPSRTYIVRVGDPNGDYTVTITFAGTVGVSTGTLTVTVSNGVDPRSFTYPWLFDDESIRICYEPGIQFSAGIPTRGEYPEWVTMCIPLDPHARCWSGLGNWTFVSGRWDDFEYYAHWIEKKDCPDCDCKCWYINGNGSYEIACIPEVLYLTINTSDCPDFLNGTYNLNQLHAYEVTLDAYPTVGPWPRKYQWITDAIECPAGGFSFAFILECGYSTAIDRPKFRLRMVRWNPAGTFFTNFAWDPSDPESIYPGSDDGPEASTLTTLTSTCDPLYLEWPILIEDTFQSSDPADSCCGGSIVSEGGESDPSHFTVIITS